MGNFLGPVAGDQVTSRPSRSNLLGATRTWFRPCSSPAAEDGTIFDADWANDMLAQMRTAMDSAGIVEDGGDDMLWRCMQSTGIRYAVAGGTANDLTAAFTPPVESLYDGLIVSLKVTAPNTTAATFTADGTATEALVKRDGSALAAGDLPAGAALLEYMSGQWRVLVGLSSAALSIRTLLTADRDYYVNASTGNDSNTGLSSGTPFLTIQKAVNVVCDTLDLDNHNVTVHVADGTYAGVTLRKVVGSGTCTILGNTTTPTNCVVATSSQPGCFQQGDGGNSWYLRGMHLTNTGSSGAGFGLGIYCAVLSAITFDTMSFGPCNYAQLNALYGGMIYCNGNYQLNGGAGAAAAHVLAELGGIVIITASCTLTINGNPSFSVAFAWGHDCGVLNIRYYTTTIVGTVTGARYYADGNGVVDTSGGGASYLPGNSSGVLNTGGQYL